MKKPFDIPNMLQQIGNAVAPFPKAAMFELFDRGYTSLFEQLISCLISIRTLDETTIPVSEKLFAKARTAKELLQFSPGQLEGLLFGTQYPGQKAYTMLGIANIIVEEYGGDLLPDYGKLIALKGVGPKCAKLALGVASGYAGISVDVHVHRVVNRWGLIETKTPEKTMDALEDLVNKDQWINVNRLMMPFGKHICTLVLPKCSTCPVLAYCRQVGVTSHR